MRAVAMDLQGMAKLAVEFVESRLEPAFAQRAADQPVRGEALHVGQLCNGVQIHVDDPSYDHAAFKPWRVQALAFKAIRRLYPDYHLWRDFPYEYVFDRLAIDVINGGPGLREWVDDPMATPADLDALTTPDEQAWIEERRPYLLY